MYVQCNTAANSFLNLGFSSIKRIDTKYARNDNFTVMKLNLESGEWQNSHLF